MEETDSNYVVIQLLSHVNSLWLPGLQQTRPPYLLLSPRVCSDSCPLSWWCYLTISFSVYLLPSILPSIRDFSNESTFHISGQNTGASASVSVSLVNIQDWFPVGLTDDLISLHSKGLSRVLSSTTDQSHEFCSTQPFLLSNSLTSIRDYWKSHSFD